ncbi:hypothetical protein F2Q70_00029810 [Brassica cretica]|uniref:Uncharacterized protein n=1 Tax=Brassica cretica TaxID=69181 RepID=A0A8S9FHX7_BRACR|nr:hypothetical protein F2Q70_00029810 [Brassica cretica]
MDVDISTTNLRAEKRALSATEEDELCNICMDKVVGGEIINALQCTCPAVPEATRKLTCYSHQILEVRIVQSAKKNAPHRSTTTLVHRSILVNHRRPRH